MQIREGQTSTPPRILLVEDEAPMRRMLNHYFLYLGYDVVQTEDLDEAEAVLDFRRFEVMVADLGLGTDSPDRGMDVVAHARYRNPGIKVIVFTGIDDPDVAAECLRRGADDYLVKPQPLAELAQRVARLLPSDFVPVPRRAS